MDADMRGVRSYIEGDSRQLGVRALRRPASRARWLHHLHLRGHLDAPKLGFAAVTPVLAAVEALALALELAPIRVNTIRPGFIDTEMWSFMTEAERDGLRAKVRSNFPARRVGTTDDIGHAALS